MISHFSAIIPLLFIVSSYSANNTSFDSKTPSIRQLASNCDFVTPNEMIGIFYSFKLLIYLNTNTAGSYYFPNLSDFGLTFEPNTGKLTGYWNWNWEGPTDGSMFYSRTFSYTNQYGSCSFLHRYYGLSSKTTTMTEGALVYIFPSDSQCNYNKNDYSALKQPIGSKSINNINFQTIEEFSSLFDNIFDPILLNGFKIIIQIYYEITSNSDQISELRCNECSGRTITMTRDNQYNAIEKTNTADRHCDYTGVTINELTSLKTGSYLSNELYIGFNNNKNNYLFSYNLKSNNNYINKMYHTSLGFIELSNHYNTLIVGLKIKPISIIKKTIYNNTKLIYSITPNLPEGLVFDSNNGIISGTPQYPLDFTVYNITSPYNFSYAVDRDSIMIQLSIRIINGPFNNSYVYNTNEDIYIESQWKEYNNIKWQFDGQIPIGLTIDEKNGIIKGIIKKRFNGIVNVKISGKIVFKYPISLKIEGDENEQINQSNKVNVNFIVVLLLIFIFY